MDCNLTTKQQQIREKIKKSAENFPTPTGAISTARKPIRKLSCKSFPRRQFRMDLPQRRKDPKERNSSSDHGALASWRKKIRIGEPYLGKIAQAAKPFSHNGSARQEQKSRSTKFERNLSDQKKAMFKRKCFGLAFWIFW
jgi:hypothetical protein